MSRLDPVRFPCSFVQPIRVGGRLNQEQQRNVLRTLGTPCQSRLYIVGAVDVQDRVVVGGTPVPEQERVAGQPALHIVVVGCREELLHQCERVAPPPQDLDRDSQHDEDEAAQDYRHPGGSHPHHAQLLRTDVWVLPLKRGVVIRCLRVEAQYVPVPLKRVDGTGAAAEKEAEDAASMAVEANAHVTLGA